MSPEYDNPGDSSKKNALRRQAEEKLKVIRKTAPLDSLNEVEIRRMLHELEVHKIELEMQNSELLHTQQELEDSQSRYFDLFDLAPVGYLIVDQQGLILESNLTASKLLGVVRSQLIHQAITRFIYPEDQDIYYHHRQQLFESISPQTCELRILQPHAEPLWVLLGATISRNADNEPVCRVVIQDISERVTAVNAMYKSEQLYQAIVSNTPDHIVMQDSQLKYRFVANPQLGLTEKDMNGKSDFDILTKEEAEKLTKIKTQVMEDAKATPLNTSLFSQSGEEEFFEGSFFPKFNDQEQVDGLFGYFRNVTEQKQAEARLQESERRFRKILETVELIAVMLNTEGEVTFCNDYLLKLTGYKREDVVGQNWFDMFTAAEWKIDEVFSSGIKTDNFPAHFENEILTASGEKQWS